MIFILGVLSNIISGQIMAKATHATLFKLRNNMYVHMQGLPIKYFDTTKHGDIMSYYTNDVDTVRNLIVQIIPQSFQALVQIVVIFVFMLQISIVSTLITVLLLLPMLIFFGFFGKKTRVNFVANQVEIANLNGVIQEYIETQMISNLFNYSDQVIHKFKLANDKQAAIMKKANVLASIVFPVIFNYSNVMYIVVAIASVFLFESYQNKPILGQQITLGVIVSFVALVRAFVGPLANISENVNFFARSKAGAERIYTMLDEKLEENKGKIILDYIEKDENGNWRIANKWTKQIGWVINGEIKPFQGKVEFKNVNFSYDGKKQVLKNINISGSPGEKIALIDKTGSGKTTIANLISRFYNVSDGEIYFDDIPISSVDINSIRKTVGMVLQSTELFSGSIRDNIAYGNKEAKLEDIIEAAKLANAHDFIMALPNEYDTYITNNGEGLSQGQKQLLTIARVSSMNPTIMVLDEATSNIDSRTEKVIKESMDKLMQNQTTFAIAHRLSTIKNFNQILVIQEGEIVERGNHEQLMAKKGLYESFYHSSFSEEMS
ncbi:ABC-type multidrug/protein/lipid (MdlB-like) transport system component domain protein [Mycoplasmoides gallisepticum CA06_2006.052-5-2P]|uniref:ABC-type multidrug/protein/lipid (MdlB-like) transport system component domain protein n=1 Tax=Mycoplasmoides gallisepticum WI01_2001.043-13-2P TaxID=1159201 RepID=J3TRM8_MYCGL|nr:ABC transporter ATP-binding protein [Mycoplasmoides gallisepticum]AFP76284.1 ABC-type multidrug/protein/lipid (MdlB-like) transport system component domain protein [Mycoplasmoides gallisepticum VA94_7994-1-7P]AFP77052.1 ABC-type multidrug/protein/lipid (MdlB-like) transport system component domain protein [Mycoplasmoides gallisepticum NC95_13295-2-2P]AFP78576.1 ABC-type multidrug/protein/lipid (MdlB-like) transport system component domain protein [Mycoplasmoides gallisepticum NY01_2001.047-5-